MELILNAVQIREADRRTMQEKNISSVQLMEHAATVWTEAFLRKTSPLRIPVDIYCGPGNNGGDGLVIARLLHRHGYPVRVILPDTGASLSQDHKINLERLKENTDIPVFTSKNPETIPVEEKALAIDALFGTGLNRPLSNVWNEWVEHINRKYNLIFSVDMPSGLPTDEPFSEPFTHIKNTHVITFETIKKTFLYPETGSEIRSITVVPIGWNQDSISSEEVKERVITPRLVFRLLRPRHRFSHKGTHGRLSIMAGSENYPGAAILSCGAALRSGCGYVFLHAPLNVCHMAVQRYPECIPCAYAEPYIREFPQITGEAAVIGPGLGTHPETAGVLKQVIQLGIPCVIDADALNILSENKTWLHFLHPQTILTPHPGECDRMLGKTDSHYQRIKACREAARRWNTVIILKSAFPAVCFPDGRIYYNLNGNPGLAKAGSGDVLSGILGSLLAQGYSSHEAALLGVYLHGYSAFLRAQTQGLHSLCASDIVEGLSEAFHKTEHRNTTFLPDVFSGQEIPARDRIA